MKIKISIKDQEFNGVITSMRPPNFFIDGKGLAEIETVGSIEVQFSPEDSKKLKDLWCSEPEKKDANL